MRSRVLSACPHARPPSVAGRFFTNRPHFQAWCDGLGTCLWRRLWSQAAGQALLLAWLLPTPAVGIPPGHETRHEYDSNGNRTATVDAEGRRTEWEYDRLDRPVVRRLADGTEETTAYDEEGNRIRFEDGRGVVRTWAFDALNRPTRETIEDPAAPSGALVEVRTTYDGNGNPVVVDEDFAGGGTRRTTRVFDDFDRLFSETTQEGTLGWRYDLVGNRTRQIDSSGAATAYTFDALNRPTTVTTGGGVTSYNWLRDGRLARVDHPQGAAEIRTYDAAGRVETVTSTQHSAVVTRYAYTYDANGNRLTQDETNGGAPERTTYGYDNADRLMTVEYPGELVEYTLDAVGNRIGERTSSLGGGGPPVVTSNKTFTFDNRHRLQSIVDAVESSNNASWTFDAAGNQTSRTRNGTTSDFTWDGRNRLLEVGEGGTLVERYGYDHLDRRVSRAGSGEVVRYLWDEESILEVHDGAGLLLQKYEYGPDRLLSLWDATAPVEEARQFQLFDGLGSITALVRGDGLVQARRLWDAWGVSRGEVGETSNRFGFTGHEHDEATGLIYAKARYLDPELGRFLSEDPFAGLANEPPSLHRYLYGYANPTVYVDPDGRMAFANAWIQKLREVEDGATEGLDEVSTMEDIVAVAAGQTVLGGARSALSVVNWAANTLAVTMLPQDDPAHRQARTDFRRVRDKGVAAGRRAAAAFEADPSGVVNRVASLPGNLGGSAMITALEAAAGDPKAQASVVQISLESGLALVTAGTGRTRAASGIVDEFDDVFPLALGRPSVVVESSTSLGTVVPGGVRTWASSYQERLNQTPVNNGRWIDQNGAVGIRGESLFLSDLAEVQQVLGGSGVGIPYQDAFVDFSGVSVARVPIAEMTTSRSGNFAQADAALAELRGLSAREIKIWRQASGYTWHEHQDLTTMELVPSVLNAKFGHMGGVGELKRLAAGVKDE